MEKAFAFICGAVGMRRTVCGESNQAVSPQRNATEWERACAQDEVPARRLRQYCRRVYSLGYVPICPKLSLPQFLDYDVAEERRSAAQMSQLLLRRCRMVVVCGVEISGTMLAEIGTAERMKIICTTLDGLERISGTDENRPS